MPYQSQNTVDRALANATRFMQDGGSDALKILQDAFAIQDAGCYMLEFNAVPAKIATVISGQLEIPTIGIGAGVGTDGQILPGHDLPGMFVDFKPKFSKRCANFTEAALKGITQYIPEVKGERSRTMTTATALMRRSTKNSSR